MPFLPSTSWRDNQWPSVRTLQDYFIHCVPLSVAVLQATYYMSPFLNMQANISIATQVLRQPLFSPNATLPQHK